MKKLLIVFSLSLSTVAIYSFKANEPTSISKANADEFCDGFSDGFCEGYKEGRGQLYVCPVAPICPVSNQTTYKAGYNKGFSVGLSRGRADK